MDRDCTEVRFLLESVSVSVHPCGIHCYRGHPPEEDEVALVVERHSAAASEGGVLAEQRGKHAPHAVPQPCVKVVQNQLRLVRARPPVPLQLRQGVALGQGLDMVVYDLHTLHPRPSMTDPGIFKRYIYIYIAGVYRTSEYVPCDKPPMYLTCCNE